MKVIRSAEVPSAISIQPLASNQLFSLPSCQPSRLVTLSLRRDYQRLNGDVTKIKRMLTSLIQKLRADQRADCWFEAES